MRQCKKCGKEKELNEFVKQQIWYKHTCKECWNKKYRTGKPNLGRFKKGHIPWIKGKKNVQKRKTPKYIKRPRKIGEKRQSKQYCQWVLKVMERDNYTCKECSSKTDLLAHHIIRWQDDKTKRFNINNGKTLCRGCHSKTHRLDEIKLGVNHLKGETRS